MFIQGFSFLTSINGNWMLLNKFNSIVHFIIHFIAIQQFNNIAIQQFNIADIHKENRQLLIMASILETSAQS